MELTPAIGVGVADLHHAARTEIARIVRTAQGDPLAEGRLLIRELGDRGLITESEVGTLSKLALIAHETGLDKRQPADAYLESRDLYATMLAAGGASPVALAIASSAVGSYEIAPAPGGGVAFAKKNGGAWESRGAAAGAIIGSSWGPLGAAIGGAVGGVVGAAVDECTK
jgi:hypothetical protein